MDCTTISTSDYSDSLSTAIISPINSNLGTELARRLKNKNKIDQIANYLMENKSDTKYKTELCKSFSEQGFCNYGSKCRFAHGREDLFDKVINCKKYKQKECASFYNKNFCCYGSRCHFRHEERNLKQIQRSYFTYLNLILINDGCNCITTSNEFKRLRAFTEIRSTL